MGARNAKLASLKSALDNGFLSLYSGTMPAEPGDALSGNTELSKFTESGDGSTGLTFAAASGGAMTKTIAEIWKGLVTNSGTATFFRMYDSSDNPANASSTKVRLQGTVGLPGSGADLILEAVALVDNGTNGVGTADFTLYED
jgi:hypothetical protein